MRPPNPAPERGPAASLLLLLLLLLAGAPHAAAQNVPPAPAIVTLASVSQTTLSKHWEQEVRVQGTIGSYLGTKARYRFGMDDGSAVQVAGEYPAMGGTRWTLTARVEQMGSTFFLSEVSKEVAGQTARGSWKIDPLLLAGGLLLLGSLLAFAFLRTRNKAQREREVLERTLEEERPRPPDAPRAQEQDGILNSSAPAAPRPPAHTLVSIGAVEITAGPQVGRKFPLQVGETRLGRLPDRGVSILLDTDSEVSGYHGAIVVTPDTQMYYTDESTNGSVVDGAAVHHAQCPLHAGSRLEVGASTLQFSLRLTAAPPVPGAAPSPGWPRSAPTMETPAPAGLRSAPTVAFAAPEIRTPAPPTLAGYGAEVEVTQGPETGRRFMLSQTMTTLGRENQDIVLNDEGVSRAHATITSLNGLFKITDDGSKHGTSVNGVPLGPSGHTLTDGDQITLGLGRTVLAFHQLGGPAS